MEPLCNFAMGAFANNPDDDASVPCAYSVFQTIKSIIHDRGSQASHFEKRHMVGATISIGYEEALASYMFKQVKDLQLRPVIQSLEDIEQSGGVEIFCGRQPRGIYKYRLRMAEDLADICFDKPCIYLRPEDFEVISEDRSVIFVSNNTSHREYTVFNAVHIFRKKCLL